MDSSSAGKQKENIVSLVFIARNSPRISNMETVRTKMSAKRSLAEFLGEPDHDQNKADLAHWNNYFDTQFKNKWGVDPKTGDITTNSPISWEKVDENVPKAYRLSYLGRACGPKSDIEQCPGGQFAHLGLSYGPRSRTNTPILGEIRQQEQDSCPLDLQTLITRPVTPELTTHKEDDSDDRSQDPSASSETSSKPSSNSSLSSQTTSSTTSTTQAASISSSSRKRKQTTISEFFPQKKQQCTKRRILN